MMTTLAFLCGSLLFFQYTVYFKQTDSDASSDMLPTCLLVTHNAEGIFLVVLGLPDCSAEGERVWNV